MELTERQFQLEEHSPASLWAAPGGPRHEGGKRPLALDLSGFRGQFVGLLVGFLGLPDNSRPRGINTLAAKCRVCQVFIGGESPQEHSPLRFERPVRPAAARAVALVRVRRPSRSAKAGL